MNVDMIDLIKTMTKMEETRWNCEDNMEIVVSTLKMKSISS